MIDLSRLRHFVVVAEAGSYVQAAEELRLSQPALSRSIQALERQYGATFFDRGRTGVTLTPFGRQFLVRAQDLLSNAESLEHAIEAASAGISGTVSLGVSPNAANVLLPSLLLSLFSDYPDIRLTAVLGTPGTLARRLLDGEIEFFISRHDPDLAYERIQSEPIGEARACFLVREGHPLLGMDPLPVTALAPYPRLAATAWNEILPRVVQADVIDSLWATAEVDNFELLAGVAARSDAILVSAYGYTVADLVMLPVDLSGLKSSGTNVGFFTLRVRTLSPAAQAVGAILRNLATQRGFAVPASNHHKQGA
jgi:DNA-binding transcriptional LysR family regulator